MKALLQRVTSASVKIDENIVGSIGAGIVVLLGVAGDDSEKDADYLVDKIVNLRIFNDAQNKFNLSALQINGEMLVISQFTLLSDTRRGRRPSFTQAAEPAKAEALYNYFVMKMKHMGLKVETGRFAAHMLVEIHNDGPVTIMLDSREKLLP
ncbi:MAG: D-aminoacyl-tRNA deacylase [Dehalococcoidia bacterium]|nr:D-aminoacyl-tRNA deacylase [Dehalococcoidia bacterium]MDD5495135.1 D-aminoacyl-tRNA deacylase [Dehalococcoidia bacterium]